MSIRAERVAAALMLGLLSAAVSSAAAQQDDGRAGLAEAVHRAIDPFVADGDFAGVVLVHRPGFPDAVVPAGEASEAWGASTPFAVGSITKTFTGDVINRLVEEGELALSDTVATFLPEVARWAPITIRQLLTHSAGVPDYYNLARFRRLRGSPMPLDSFASWIASEDLDFEPGTGNAYSNSGYNLLALVIERVTGRSFADVVDTEVFERLGMKSSGAAASAWREVGVPRGRTPDLSPGGLGPPTPTASGWLLGSGSAYATAEDLGLWGLAMIERRQTSPRWSPFGWGIRERSSGRYLEQSGRIPGYSAVVRAFPDDGFVLVVLSAIESDAVTHVADGVQALVFGEEPAAWERRVPTNLDPRREGDYLGAYRVAPGFVLTVGPVDGGIGVAVGEGGDLEFGVLQPLGSDAFFFRTAYVGVGFVRDGSGAVTGMTWADAGPYPKIR